MQEATCGYRKKPKIAKSNRRNYDQQNGMPQTNETVDDIARDEKKALSQTFSWNSQLNHVFVFFACLCACMYPCSKLADLFGCLCNTVCVPANKPRDLLLQFSVKFDHVKKG